MPTKTGPLGPLTMQITSIIPATAQVLHTSDPRGSNGLPIRPYALSCPVVVIPVVGNPEAGQWSFPIGPAFGSLKHVTFVRPNA